MTFRVKSRYDKHSKEPYIRDLIDKVTGEVVFRLSFDHEPSWDEVVAAAKRLEASDQPTPVTLNCYVCGAELTPDTTHIIKFTDSSFNLCPHCHDATKSFFGCIQRTINNRKEDI